MKHRKDISLFVQNGSIRDFANFAYVMKGEDVKELFDYLNSSQIKRVLTQLRNIITRNTHQTLVNPNFTDDHIKHKYNKLLQGIFGGSHLSIEEIPDTDVLISHYVKLKQTSKKI